MMEFPDELAGPWRRLDPRIWRRTDPHEYHQFAARSIPYLRRRTWLPNAWSRAVHLAGEYMRAGSSVLDVGCGSGAALECFRHAGCLVVGMDWYGGCQVAYRPFMESQGLPLVVHDAMDVPWPFCDGSFSLVYSTNAITLFGPPSGWGKVLSEMARVARECMVVTINRGVNFEDGRRVIEAWSERNQLEWVRDRCIAEPGYKWVASPFALASITPQE